MEQIREILVKQREAGAKCKGEEKGKECLPELSTPHPHPQNCHVVAVCIHKKVWIKLPRSAILMELFKTA